jgi:hypothetical protein
MQQNSRITSGVLRQPFTAFPSDRSYGLFLATRINSLKS